MNNRPNYSARARLGRARHFLVLLAGILLAGCGYQEILVAKSADVPAGIDLSGQWRLQKESDDANEQLAEARREAGDRFSVPGSGKNSRPKKGKGALVHVFLENGTALKITQTDYGLFVSFDRSIVEEYRFGENRRVNVGPVEAQRVSGWLEDGYIIETLDDEGNKLVDRYLLQDAGELLMRQVSIYQKGVLSLTVVQKFSRAG